jgi:SAM-dependent methyltransferase
MLFLEIPMLPRVLEPEVMDTEEEARDYDAMEHGEVNRSFASDFFAFASSPRRLLDVGTGTALIPLELCRQNAEVHVTGVDLASHMLALARENVQRSPAAARIELTLVDAKSLPFADASFEAVLSNSIVHHIPDPAVAFREMLRVASRALFVRDLLRPADEDELARLLRLHGGGTPGTAQQRRQVALFEASLRAALTMDEVRAMVAPLGIPESAVQRTSDRHFTLAFSRPRT